MDQKNSQIKYSYYRKPSIDSKQSLSRLQWNFSEKQKKNLNLFEATRDLKQPLCSRKNDAESIAFLDSKPSTSYSKQKGMVLP